MTKPIVCPYGEWLWRRINRGGFFNMRRYAHYWVHIFRCPWCNYLLWKDEWELMRE